jgi:hypothetical protein
MNLRAGERLRVEDSLAEVPKVAVHCGHRSLDAYSHLASLPFEKVELAACQVEGLESKSHCRCSLEQAP